MPLKLFTLNIEGDLHLDRVRDAIALHVPDVVCLQEVFEVDCQLFLEAGPYEVKYAITTHVDAANTFRLAPKGNWGMAVLTRVPVKTQSIVSYADSSAIRIFRQPNDPRRAVIVTELVHEECSYRIAATHFTWSPNGIATDEQREDFLRLRQVMNCYPDYVLCGDFNSPRGGEMFAKFTDELSLIDHLPRGIVTTIDPQHHRAGALESVVDTVFSTPEYHVANLQVLDGLSDHKAILVTIERS